MEIPAPKRLIGHNDLALFWVKIELFAIKQGTRLRQKSVKGAKRAIKGVKKDIQSWRK